MYSSRIEVILFFMLFVRFASGQGVHFTHYKIGKDLNCRQIYAAFEDSKGYLWLGTNNGVIKFDGVNFKNYTVDDGMESNDVYRLGEFENGMIWFSSSNSVTFFEQGRIVSPDFNRFLDRKEIMILDVTIKNDSTFIISTYPEGVLELTGQSSKQYIGTSLNMFIELKDKKKGSLYYNNEVYEIELKDGPIEVIRCEVLILNDSLVLFSLGKELWLFNTKNKKRQRLHDFDSKILSLLQNVDGRILITSSKEGLQQLDITPLKITPLLPAFFKNKETTSVVQSYEGGYWVTTLNEGMYYIPTMDIRYIDHPKIDQAPINKVLSNDTAVFIATKNAYIGTYRNGVFEKIANFNTEMRDITFDENGVLYSSTLGYGLSNLLDKEIRMRNIRPRKILFHNNQLYGVSRSGLGQYNKNNRVFLNEKEGRIDSWSFCKKGADTLLIASSSGLWEYYLKQDKFHYLGDSIPEFSGRIQSVYYHNGITVCCTLKGLVLEKNKKIIRIAKEDGLISNSCNSAFISKEEVLWVSTQQGISKITDIFDLEKRQMQSIGLKDGLGSNVVFGGTELNDTLFFATSLGVSYFHKELKIDHVSPHLYIDSISVNKVNLPIDKLYDLSFKENFIKIDYHVVSHKEQRPFTYYSRILPIDSTWVAGLSPFTILNALSPGAYCVEIQAGGSQQEEASAVTRIHIYINPPVYQTWWFLCMASLILFALFYTGFKMRVVRLSKRQQLLDELNQMKQHALSAQMNPHFIFNSLSSIQHFILTNDKKNSNKFLTRFASFMRIVLDHSRLNLITMKQELEALEIYIGLEALRFKGRFEYQIDCSPALNPDRYKIPPLLLQPYVENAIWHGLMHKTEGKGLLKISIKLNNEFLQCVIEDNGVGRVKSQMLENKTKKQHQPAGLVITEKRAELAGKLTGQKFHIHIVDLKNTKNESVGTQVIIDIPVL